MSFLDMTLGDFAEKLASRDAVPGGGGASAMAGALGAALASMAANLTTGKKKFAAYEDDLARIINDAKTVSAALLGLIDGDAAAFEPLSKAYSIPKDEPGRGETMEKCLRQAAAVPMDILRLSCRSIDILEELTDKCSPLAISDVATGAVLCWSAMYGSAMNVFVNTKLMADRDYAKTLNDEADALMGTYWKKADNIYETILAGLR